MSWLMPLPPGLQIKNKTDNRLQQIFCFAVHPCALVSASCMRIVFVSIILLSSLAQADDCEISGKAILWAYDACFWQYETDDSLHPGVIDCVKSARQDIKAHGECPAKRIFKSRICELAKQWGLDEPDPQTCMSIDKPLGSAVSEGGI